MEKPSLHAFISYRRGGGSPYARIVYDRLTARKMEAFLDVDRMPSGHFDENLYRKIEEAPNFIIVLTPGCLDRCKDAGDWVCAEIVHAIKHNKNIIPVFAEGFSFPDKQSLPAEIHSLITHNGLSYNHEFFDAFVDKLVSLMVLKRKNNILLTSIIAAFVLSIVVITAAVLLHKKPDEHVVSRQNVAQEPVTRQQPPEEVILHQQETTIISQSTKENQPQSKASSQEGFKQTQKKVSAAPNITNTKNGEVVINAIKEIHDFETLSAKLQELKAQGMIMFGKKSAFINPEDCYVVIVDKGTRQIMAILDRSNPERINILSNNAVPDFENKFKDQAQIWMEVY